MKRRRKPHKLRTGQKEKGEAPKKETKGPKDRTKKGSKTKKERERRCAGAWSSGLFLSMADADAAHTAAETERFAGPDFHFAGETERLTPPGFHIEAVRTGRFQGKKKARRIARFLTGRFFRTFGVFVTLSGAFSCALARMRARAQAHSIGRRPSFESLLNAHRFRRVLRKLPLGPD